MCLFAGGVRPVKFKLLDTERSRRARVGECLIFLGVLLRGSARVNFCTFVTVV